MAPRFRVPYKQPAGNCEPKTTGPTASVQPTSMAAEALPDSTSQPMRRAMHGVTMPPPPQQPRKRRRGEPLHTVSERKTKDNAIGQDTVSHSAGCTTGTGLQNTLSAKEHSAPCNVGQVASQPLQRPAETANITQTAASCSESLWPSEQNEFPSKSSATSSGHAAKLWPSSSSSAIPKGSQKTKQLSLVDCAPAHFTGHAARADKLREMPGGAAGNPRMSIAPGRKPPVTARPTKQSVKARTATAISTAPARQASSPTTPAVGAVFETEVRGMRFYAGALEIARNLAPSQCLYCEREPTNTQDSNAIKVFSAVSAGEGQQIGHIAREVAVAVATYDQKYNASQPPALFARAHGPLLPGKNVLPVTLIVTRATSTDQPTVADVTTQNEVASKCSHPWTLDVPCISTPQYRWTFFEKTATKLLMRQTGSDSTQTKARLEVVRSVEELDKGLSALISRARGEATHSAQQMHISTVMLETLSKSFRYPNEVVRSKLKHSENLKPTVAAERKICEGLPRLLAHQPQASECSASRAPADLTEPCTLTDDDPEVIKINADLAVHEAEMAELDRSRQERLQQRQADAARHKRNQERLQQQQQADAARHERNRSHEQKELSQLTQEKSAPPTYVLSKSQDILSHKDNDCQPTVLHNSLQTLKVPKSLSVLRQHRPHRECTQRVSTDTASTITAKRYPLKTQMSLSSLSSSPGHKQRTMEALAKGVHVQHRQTRTFSEIGNSRDEKHSDHWRERRAEQQYRKRQQQKASFACHQRQTTTAHSLSQKLDSAPSLLIQQQTRPRDEIDAMETPAVDLSTKSLPNQLCVQQLSEPQQSFFQLHSTHVADQRNIPQTTPHGIYERQQPIPAGNQWCKDEVHARLLKLRKRIALRTGSLPFRVMNNQSLEAIVNSAPTSISLLYNIDGISPKIVEQHGHEILAAVNDVFADSRHESTADGIPNNNNREPIAKFNQAQATCNDQWHQKHTGNVVATRLEANICDTHIDCSSEGASIPTGCSDTDATDDCRNSHLRSHSLVALQQGHRSTQKYHSSLLPPPHQQQHQHQQHQHQQQHQLQQHQHQHQHQQHQHQHQQQQQQHQHQHQHNPLQLTSIQYTRGIDDSAAVLIDKHLSAPQTNATVAPAVRAQHYQESLSTSAPSQRAELELQDDLLSLLS